MVWRLAGLAEALGPGWERPGPPEGVGPSGPPYLPLKRCLSPGAVCAGLFLEKGPSGLLVCTRAKCRRQRVTFLLGFLLVFLLWLHAALGDTGPLSSMRSEVRPGTPAGHWPLATVSTAHIISTSCLLSVPVVGF